MKSCEFCGQALAVDAVYCGQCGNKQVGLQVEAAHDRAGQVFGAYRLGGVIGSGAMGDVYKGEHTSVGRQVAVKVLKKDLANNPQVVSRFFAEARVVNQIQHPCIVQTIDFLTEPDNAVVMELLDGVSLGALLKKGPLSEARAVRFAKQIAEGMAAVHAAGVVHRDLKPDNVFVIAGDTVKILDFGVAKLRKGLSGSQVSTLSAGFLGTLAYMAPEQVADAKAIDQRADIYSFGVMLYEMIDGARPFEAETFGEMVIKHVTIKPRQLRQASPKIADLVMKCLAKDPAARPQAMGEIAEQLLAYTPAPPRKPRSRLWYAAPAVLLAAGATALSLRAPPLVSETPRPLVSETPPPPAQVETKVTPASVPVSPPVDRALSPRPIPAKKSKRSKPQSPAGKDDVVNPFED